MRGNRGFVLPLAILAGLAVTLFIVVVSSLGKSSRARITHLGKAQTAFHIGYSAMSRFMARLHQTGWADRDFRDRPVQLFQAPLLGGEYDLHGENTPGLNRDFQTDLYIRVRFEDMKRLFFWRFQYRDDLLDLSNRSGVLFFGSIPVEQFPGPAGSIFGSKVDRILAVRRANRDTADDLSFQIQGIQDAREIARILGTSAPSATNTPEFSPTAANADTFAVPGLPPIPFPSTKGAAYTDSPLLPPVTVVPGGPVTDPLTAPPPSEIPTAPTVPENAAAAADADEEKTANAVAASMLQVEKAIMTLNTMMEDLSAEDIEQRAGMFPGDPTLAGLLEEYRKAVEDLESHGGAARKAGAAAMEAEPVAKSGANVGILNDFNDAVDTALSEFEAASKAEISRFNVNAKIDAQIALLKSGSPYGR